MTRHHDQKSECPVCAYTSGVLVGFVNALSARRDVVCVERACQAQGNDACQFELMPSTEAVNATNASFDDEPPLSQQLGLLEIIFDRMPMGIAVLDRDLVLRRCNPTWAGFIERYTPTPASRVVPGAKVVDLFPGAELLSVPRFRRALAGETVRENGVRLESGGIVSYWDVVITPLVQDGEVVGIVDVTIDATARVQAYQDLERRVEERTRELSTLLEVSHNVVSTLDLELLLGLILDQLKVVVDYSGATIFVLEDSELAIVAYRGPISDREMAELRLPLARARPNQEVVTSRKPLIIPDVREDSPMARLFQESAGDRLETTYGYIRSWMGVPLIVKERVIGMLTLDHGEPGHYSHRHAHLVLAFANQVAVAIENARLYAEARRRVDENRTLFAVQQAVTGRLDPDAVLQLIADEARRLTSARRAAVFLLEGEDLRVAAFSGEGGLDPAVGYRLPLRQSLTGLAILSGKPARFADAESDPHANAEVVGQLGIKSLVTVPMLSGPNPIGGISVADKLSGTFGADDERVLTMLASGAVVGLENARLYAEEQERRREADQRREVAEGLRDILATLNSNRPLDEVLDYIVAQACRLLGTEMGALFRLQPDGKLLTIQAARGLDPEYVAHMGVPVGRGAVGQAVLTLGPVPISNLTTALWQGARLPSDPELRARLIGMADKFRALLGVPLIIKDEVYGGIVLYYSEPREFSTEDIELAKAFGDQAALAIENARLRVRAEQAAAEAERSRLARDLHDAVTQTLFSASLIAEVLPRLWERNPEEGRRRLEELRQLTRGALAEMRTLLLELRPTALMEASLSDLLRQLAEAIRGRARVPVEVSIEGQAELPQEVRVGLYRIAQEALNNVAKHSGASWAKVELRCEGGRVELRVVDDGRGFDIERISSDHLGLSIMRERAEAIGATLEIDSRLGQWTEVKAVWQHTGERESK
mgnify:FL=1